MLVLFAMVVVEMHGRNQFTERRKTFFQAFLFGQFREEGVADIEVEAQASESRLVHKGAKVVGTAHFAQSIFDANGNAGVARVQDQVLE